MTPFIQVVTTVDTEEMAEKIAAHVLEQKLAACVQISRCRSLYRWQGKVENDIEFSCLMKSREDLYPALEKALKDIHPYDVPEILAAPVLSGSEGYLSWLDGELLDVNTGKIS